MFYLWGIVIKIWCHTTGDTWELFVSADIIFTVSFWLPHHRIASVCFYFATSARKIWIRININECACVFACARTSVCACIYWWLNDVELLPCTFDFGTSAPSKVKVSPPQQIKFFWITHSLAVYNSKYNRISLSYAEFLIPVS